jgi:hypothetical protein
MNASELDPKLIYNVLSHFVLFHYSTKGSAKQAELVPLMHKFVMKLCWNFSQYPIHFNGCKTHILKRFGPFPQCMKVGVKYAELVPLMYKFVPWSCVGIFAKNTPDLLHWIQT